MSLSAMASERNREQQGETANARDVRTTKRACGTAGSVTHGSVPKYKRRLDRVQCELGGNTSELILLATTSENECSGTERRSAHASLPREDAWPGDRPTMFVNIERLLTCVKSTAIYSYHKRLSRPSNCISILRPTSGGPELGNVECTPE